MGAGDWVRITKSKAIEIIIKKVLEADNELLANIFNEAANHRIDSFTVVPDGTDNDERELML